MLKKNILKAKWLLFSGAFVLTSCSTMDHAFAPQMQKASVNNPAPYAAPAITGKRKIGKPYEIMGQTYYPLQSSDGYRKKGVASWYGKDFHAKKTANGEMYDMYAMTAAHPTLPLPTYVRVTNLENNLSVVVRVNDRGPFLRGRLIDLSYRAAIALDMAEKGTAPVLLEALPTDGSALRTPAHQQTYRVAQNHKTAAPIVKVQTSKPLANSGFTTRISQRAESTELEPSKSNEKNAQATSHSVDMYIQTGAFSNKDNALREEGNLANLYPRQTKIVSVNAFGKNFHRVRVGPLKTVEEADKVLAKIANNGWPNAQIVVE